MTPDAAGNIGLSFGSNVEKTATIAINAFLSSPDGALFIELFYNLNNLKQILETYS